MGCTLPHHLARPLRLEALLLEVRKFVLKCRDADLKLRVCHGTGIALIPVARVFISVRK